MNYTSYKNGDLLISNEDFANLKFDTIVSLLKEDLLRINEQNLWKSLILWDSKHYDNFEGIIKMKEYVRFCPMTSQFYEKFVFDKSIHDIATVAPY